MEPIQWLVWGTENIVIPPVGGFLVLQKQHIFLMLMMDKVFKDITQENLFGMTLKHIVLHWKHFTYTTI